MTDVFAVLATGMVWTVAWINGSRLVVSSWMAFRVGDQDNAALRWTLIPWVAGLVKRWNGCWKTMRIGVSHGRSRRTVSLLSALLLKPVPLGVHWMRSPGAVRLLTRQTRLQQLMRAVMKTGQTMTTFASSAGVAAQIRRHDGRCPVRAVAVPDAGGPPFLTFE